VLLAPRIGEVFEGIISGMNPRGLWVRVSNPHVEGKLVGHTDQLDVGDRLRVRLTSVDPERGFIDFELA
jgi:exoribonuclease-2